MAAHRVVLPNIARALRRRAGCVARTTTRTPRRSTATNFTDTLTISAAFNRRAFVCHNAARRTISDHRAAPLNFNRERPADDC